MSPSRMQVDAMSRTSKCHLTPSRFTYSDTKSSRLVRSQKASSTSPTFVRLQIGMMCASSPTSLCTNTLCSMVAAAA